MTSIIRMTPLSGGKEESPHCYLLEVDQFTFLLDCGWDSNFDMNFIKELKKHIPKIDAVLLSYPDNLHLGALPYAVGKLGLSCPIYATVPVYKMGQMFMYDTYQARHNIEDFSLFTLDEVDNTFEKITQLKYNQTVALKGKGEGLSIVPLPAGHMIGGTLWKIAKDGEEDILYAVDMNHKKERHLNGCDIEKVQRPSLLIMDAYNAKYTQRPRRKRDEKLMTNILQTLRNNGNVLVCVDTAGRVLELAHMVDQLWQNKDSGLLAYSLALLNNVSYNVVEFAKSQIEWMSEKLMRTFEGKRNNPFQFKHLKLCHSMNEVNKVPSPKVVLASMPDLESGFSRELFIQWAPNPKNSIILTSRSADGTLGQDLIMKGGNRTIPIEIKKRVKLTGSELEEYRREEGKEKSKAKGVESLLDEEDSSDDEMEVSTIVTGSKPSVIKHDIIMKPETNKTQSGFFKSTKTKYPMFPFYEEKIRWDDYGEIIRPEEWMDKGADNPDENMDTSNHPDREEEPDYEEIPTKCISSTQNLSVKANVQFIDFEGRSDGENIAKLVTHLKPRRVIVVRGNEESCKGLSEVCKEIVNRVRGGNAEQKQYVFTPVNGEVVDATTESFIYQVRLPDPLMGLLSFSKGKDGYLAWVDGVIQVNQQELMDIQPQADIEQEVDKNQLIPSLEPMPVEEVEGHPAIFVNELKLSDFKLELTKNNIASEFQGGVLFCGENNTVALRRHDSGRVTIEGCLCDEYYLVRDLLYEQYAIL